MNWLLVASYWLLVFKEKTVKSKSYESLDVWHRALDLSIKLYHFTANFPKEEMYGLTSQMRRCAVSIPSNIAEGCVRGSYKDFLRFINIALGSAAELQTQLIITERLGYSEKEASLFLQKEAQDIAKMLNALKRSIEKLSEPVTSNQ